MSLFDTEPSEPLSDSSPYGSQTSSFSTKAPNEPGNLDVRFRLSVVQLGDSTFTKQERKREYMSYSGPYFRTFV